MSMMMPDRVESVESVDPIVVGERLYLRELDHDDVGPAYERWMNDEEVVRYLESRFQRHSLESLQKFVVATRADPCSTLFGIMLRAGGRHIGNIKLGPVVAVHGTADIGLLIGEKDCWGRGYATESIVLVCRYAFENLKLRKVTASCYASNESSARAFEKAGFQREGLRRAQFADGNEYVDQILLGLLCRD